MTASHRESDTFYVVDFDRTLANTDKLVDVFTPIAGHYAGIPREHIEKTNEDMKSRGDSFDVAMYIHDFLKNNGTIEKWDELQTVFIHEARSQDMLLPGAKELLDLLERTGEPYGIVTSGNPLWQRPKIAAAGLNNVPCDILESFKKGLYISSWEQDNGTFQIPDILGGGVVKRVVVIDDKAKSFTGMPDAPSEGFWVLDQNHVLPSQRGEVPMNVKLAKDLFEVVEKLTAI